MKTNQIKERVFKVNTNDISISHSTASDILKVLKYVKQNELLKNHPKKVPLDNMINELKNIMPKKQSNDSDVPLMMRLEDYGRGFKGTIGNVPVIFDTVGLDNSRWYFYMANNEYDLSYNSLWENKHYPSLEQCIKQVETWLEIHTQ